MLFLLNMKNPFKEGDLVKLRPDVLGRHSKGIPAHAGFTTMEFQWRNTLQKLADKVGKITRVSPDSKFVNVEYPSAWTSKDQYGKPYSINSIGIDFTELVPSTENPDIKEGLFGFGSKPENPVGSAFAARQLVSAYNDRKLDRNTLIKKMEELMWRSRTQDPNNWGWLKSTVDRLKAPAPQGIQLKFEEGVGYVYDKDMKKDPKHIKGKRWTVKYESEPDLSEHGHTMKTPVNEDMIREVIQELLREAVDPKGLSYSIKILYNGIIKAKIQFKNSKNPELKTKWQIAGRSLLQKINAAFLQYKELTGNDWLPSNRPKPEWFDSQSPAVAQSPTYDPVLEQLKKKVVETRETPDKEYIVFGRSGPTVKYYCNNPLQGERMVQFAQSMAYRFKTLEQVRNTIADLSKKYKGITNWDYEIVQARFPNAVRATQPIITSPNRRGHTISRPVKVGDEWVVKWMTDGKRDEGKTYYTDDRDDAFSTYDYMLKRAEEENKKTS